MKIPFLSNRGKPSDNGRDGKILALGGGDAIFEEQFKALRAKFEYRTDMLGWKVIGVTSSIAGEGKTLTCVKIGAGLSTAGRKKVLLVDADIRKADLTGGLGLAKQPGLSDVLRGLSRFADVVRTTSLPGLSAVTAGSTVPDPANLLSGAPFEVFILEARKSFDIILMDLPPVVPVADTISVREKIDGFVFIYRAGLTPLGIFRQAIEEIGEKKVLGVILNGVEPKSQKYYTKYYGAYYIRSGERGKKD